MFALLLRAVKYIVVQCITVLKEALPALCSVSTFQKPLSTSSCMFTLSLQTDSTGLQPVLAMARNLSFGTRHSSQICYNALNLALKDPTALKSSTALKAATASKVAKALKAATSLKALSKPFSRVKGDFEIHLLWTITKPFLA